MATTKFPFSNEKVQQFIVQFACRTPIRKDFSSAERKALENLLRDVDQERFQLFSDEAAQNVPYFFQAARQHIIDAVTIAVPSFILTNDSVTLLAPIKIGPKFLEGRGNSFDTSDLNKKMSSILFQVQNAIRGIRYNRAGKIFHLLLGPFGEEDKGRLFQKLISPELSLEDVGELDLDFARYVGLDGELHNIKTVLKHRQMNIGDTFQLDVRVDINNRKQKDRLDPPEIEKVWARADKVIFDHLAAIFVE